MQKDANKQKVILTNSLSIILNTGKDISQEFYVCIPAKNTFKARQCESSLGKTLSVSLKGPARVMT